MAYQARPDRLTPDQVAALVALGRRVDLTPGPGGARITDLGALTDAGLALVGLAGRPRLAFVVLGPSRQIAAHTDPPIAGRRYHVPLAVNPGCWSFHAGVWDQLAVGQFYEMDPTEIHGAVNWGATVRLHLMIDTED